VGDYILALEELEKALVIDPDNLEINNMYNNLRNEIENQKKGEKKIFKSFFRNVNKCVPDPKDFKIENYNSNIGKSELKLLDMIIENSYVLIKRLESSNLKVSNSDIEIKQLENVIDKAKKYKYDLERLLRLDFNNPNQELKQFALENDLNLSDNNVKKYFLKLRDDFIAKINKFYKENLSLDNLSKPSASKTTKPVKKEKEQNVKNRVQTNQNKEGNSFKQNYLFFFSLGLLILVFFLFLIMIY
jgi:hypothetical protein